MRRGYCEETGEDGRGSIVSGDTSQTFQPGRRCEKLMLGGKIYQLSAVVYHKRSVAFVHYKSVNRVVGVWVCSDD